MQVRSCPGGISSSTSLTALELTGVRQWPPSTVNYLGTQQWLSYHLSILVVIFICDYRISPSLYLTYQCKLYVQFPLYAKSRVLTPIGRVLPILRGYPVKAHLGHPLDALVRNWLEKSLIHPHIDASLPSPIQGSIHTSTPLDSLLFSPSKLNSDFS